MTDLVPWLKSSDARALSLTLWGEARGEPIEGRVAVASVIRNRARARYRGQTIAEVCLWPAQFSCWSPNGGAANYAHLMGVARALADGGVPPWSDVERAIYDETCWIASGIVEGLIRDRVRGATHYLTESLFVSTPPTWAKGVVPVCRVGRHVFLAGVA